MSARRFALLLLAGALAAGCAGSPGGLSSLAVESQVLKRDVETAAVARGVEARVVTHIILWVPSRPLGPSLEEAVSEALKRGNGQVLVNASVERIAWYVPLLYGEYGWLVRGDVVRLREKPPPEQPTAPPTEGGTERPAVVEPPAAP
jgi:hypothetical protein